MARDCAYSQAILPSVFSTVQQSIASELYLSDPPTRKLVEFFERKGFSPEQRNTVSAGNEWLSNTTMKKKLAANEDQR